MNRNNTSVLILAGGSLKSKFDFIKASSECPALLPINCKSVVSYIISFYSQYSNCKLYIATNEKYETEIKQELSTFDFDLNFIFMPETDSVISSLEYSLKQIENKNGSVIVNLVTSIPIIYPEIGDIQFSDTLSQSRQWSGYFNLGNKAEIVLKNESSVGEKNSFYAFTGVFHLSYDTISSFVKKKEIDRSDLLSLFVDEDLAEYNIVKSDWLDCGHEINYYETKTKLISSRSFNNISFVERGIIKKKSTNALKLEQEANYYNLLPKDISIAFPRLISDFRMESGKGVYELEFYGYPNVAELILYWNLSYDVLQRMFEHFNQLLLKFKKYPCTISKDDFNDFYKEKLFSRVGEYFEQLNSDDLEILKNEIIVNGKRCEPLNVLENFINKKIQNLYDEKDFCIMHGDFCYNNILYDIPTGIIKLIDPRGSFNGKNKGVNGDRKYDLAKLAHSAIGGYDFFVNNKYNFKRIENTFEYSFENTKHDITEKLMRELIERNGYNYNDIKFIMGTLFISMCPLHKDSAKRQIAFFVHGLKILNEVYEDSL
jgi:hypothetical protein